jgi:autotransporter-associated beta strand protein
LGSAATIPASTVLTLGDSSSSKTGTLKLGDSNGVRSVTLAGISDSGSSNSIVGNNSGNAQLTFNIAGSNTYNGKLGDTGTNQNNFALNKNGVGTLVLNGASSYAGFTSVNVGKLLVNGTATGSGQYIVGNTTNSTAGTLGGIGTIKPAGVINVTAFGTIEPGNGGIGTLTIDSSGTASANMFSLSSGAQLTFELDLGLQSDKILLSNGAANDIKFTLNTINFSDLSTGNSLAAGQYTLFDAGSTSGAYTGLTTDGSGVITAGLSIGTGLTAFPGSNLQVSGNKIVLNVVPEPGAWMSLLGGCGMLLGLRRRRH